jgi:hypothetical protein
MAASAWGCAAKAVGAALVHNAAAACGTDADVILDL